MEGIPQLENDQVVDMVGIPYFSSGEDEHWDTLAASSRLGKRVKLDIIEEELSQDQKQLLTEPTHNSEDVTITVENDNGANESRHVSGLQALPSTSTAEETLTTERQHIPSSKFPKIVDRCNSEVFHGIKDVSFGEQLKQGRGRSHLERTYECFCGTVCTSYAAFRKHYNNEIFAGLRCPFCTKKFKEESTLQEHCSRRHGNSFNSDKKPEGEVKQGETGSNLDQVESKEGPKSNLGDDNDDANGKTIAELETRLPRQMKLCYGKFPPAKDVTRPFKFHGLTDIVSKGKLDGNRLLKTYNCICGMECVSYADFRRHYTSDSAGVFL